jgi:hypothetical protein
MSSRSQKFLNNKISERIKESSGLKDSANFKSQDLRIGQTLNPKLFQDFINSLKVI